MIARDGPSRVVIMIARDGPSHVVIMIARDGRSRVVIMIARTNGLLGLLTVTVVVMSRDDGFLTVTVVAMFRTWSGDSGRTTLGIRKC